MILKATNDMEEYHKEKVGEIELTQEGINVLTISAEVMPGNPFELKSINLVLNK